MNDSNTKGFETAMSGFSAASKSLQTFASELTRMSKESMDHTSQLVDKLRGAKSLEDIVAIQTSFMQQSFTSYAEYTKRFGELLTMMPVEMAKHGQAAMQQGADQANQQFEHAKDQFVQNTDNYQHNNY